MAYQPKPDPEPELPRSPSLAGRLRVRAGSFVVDNLFRGMAAAGKLHPLANPQRHQVEVLRNRAYRATGLAAHRLDIYRPTHRTGPLPIVLYVHGGGFRILSK